MFLHPAFFMLIVWAAAIALYVLLPFRLIDRELSTEGFYVLLVSLLLFMLASLLIPKAKYAVKHYKPRKVSFRYEFVLKTVCCIALIAGFSELLMSSLDLQDAYLNRDQRASDLLKGNASSSSKAFQILFLTYPAGFVYIARAIIFEERIPKFYLLLFGFAPVVMATLAMGGRAPLLYALCIAFFSGVARYHYTKYYTDRKKLSYKQKVIYGTAIFFIGGACFIYFAAVFIARAEASAGGVVQMFEVAKQVWGIGFDGAGADFLFALFGEEVVYLIFVFVWYLVQGIIMGNVIFTHYEGPYQLGVYGVDLMSALMRRLDGELVASYFDYLMDMGTYGFLPSAFGSLYVDFKYFGIIFVVLWGGFAGFVYQQVKAGIDSRWFLFVPFLTTGIVFSLINTPLGFTNGFVTHGWVVFVFLLSKDFASVVGSGKGV